MQVDPINPELKAAGSNLLTPQFDEPLSHFALKFDLRRYIPGVHAASGQQLNGCLNLVDLAGSERTARSGAEGQRMKEAGAYTRPLFSST